jgi:hypothetical protein
VAVDAGGGPLTVLPGTPPADGVQLIRPGTGLAWGVDDTRAAPVLLLYRTTDSARTWQRFRFTLPASSQAAPLLDFSDPDHGWLVAGGTTWRTSDGDRTWH